MTEAAGNRNRNSESTADNWIDSALATAKTEMDQYVHRKSDPSAAVAELMRQMDGGESRLTVARPTSTSSSTRAGTRPARAQRPSHAAGRRDHSVAAKIVVAGGFGVGKTALIRAVSEIEPLTTEAEMTMAGSGIDDLALIPAKAATTVFMDFGRVTIADDLILYLFGAPGQDRFWFVWDELIRGVLGAVVLVDVRRLSDCFATIDFFENRGIPHVVAINQFDGAPQHGHAELREALAVDDGTPLLICDVRRRDSAKEVLVTLVEHVMAQPVARADRPA